MPSFDRILAPGRIGSLEVPNRVLLAPMGTEMCTPDGRSTPREAAYYRARAAGGTGVVMSGITAVQSDTEPITQGLARIDTDGHIAGIAAIAEAVHSVGGLFALQLTAGLGRNINTVREGQVPVSASDNTWFGDPSIRCRPLTTDEIAIIVRRFGEAAVRARQAGVDMIDLHGHTGYVLDQFLSPVWNRRTDAYGGSVQNRVRFTAEIVAAIKESYPGVPVSFRLSVDHRFEGGRTPASTREIAVELERAGIDLIIADEGSYEAMDYVFPPYYLGDACMAGAATALKEVVSIPVAAVGNLRPVDGERLLEQGRADFVAIGRGLIADPDLVNKLRAGRSADVRPCIRCNAYCTGNAFFGKPVECAVNPAVSHELEAGPVPSANPRHVVVIGGGPGGMEAARTAALCGHTVDLYEQDEQLGGVLLPAATPAFKRELRSMITWWERQLAGLDVTVHTGVTIAADSPEVAAADEIIVATGSVPLRPRGIEGLDEHTVDVLAFHRGAAVGKRVLVAGGGLSGADAALELARDGHRVTLVEVAPELARDMLMVNRVTLLRDLSEAGVRVLTGHRITRVTAGGAVAEGPDGEVTLEADTVVSAFGVLPARSLVEQLGDSPKVHPIGDCVQPAKVGEAVRAGYAAALALG
ncbi:FAD-dependent oxidoreductase [Kineosporia sp. J2-2]|uniref:FAD-dependent oxidoreductase n=1 Tax=Kineosporia corallincola TaxID=2835133 RepID=A0ABS5TKI6_9ACTN|nr:FAD-dependent oxidoreductase [Kineosporia corallincola]MBT0771619.1 FAD-dependent oxidoreductase [Kineosporia corallincola]